MYNQYYFCERARSSLIKFLKENNVKYTPDTIEKGELISFSILSNSAAAHRIMKKLEALVFRRLR